MPRSSARRTKPTPSFSGSTHACQSDDPNDIMPRQTLETCSPVFPRYEYSTYRPSRVILSPILIGATSASPDLVGTAGKTTPPWVANYHSLDRKANGMVSPWIANAVRRGSTAMHSLTPPGLMRLLESRAIFDCRLKTGGYGNFNYALCNRR